MIPTQSKGLVLGVHPTTHGYGWALFESPLSPVDWGLASAQKSRRGRLMARFERLLARYEPTSLILERFEAPFTKRADSLQLLCRGMVQLATTRGMDVRTYGRDAIRTCFASAGATTRYDIAQCVAHHIEVFRRRMPPKRKAWAGQDPRQSIFDAAALVITDFAVHGRDP